MNCPVSFCQAHVRHGHLMCRTCWSAVPRQLQAKVRSSWKHFRSLPGRFDPEAKLEARKSYLNASQAAIDAAEASRP